MIRITKWGPLRLGDKGGGHFWGASNLESISSDISLRGVTDMSNMFRNATKFNSDISSWDVSKITNMSNMFRNATAFNQNISNWAVGEVINMSNMFRNATAFNQDLSSWRVCKVTEHEFFGRDVSAWTDAKKPKFGSPCIESVTFNGVTDVYVVEDEISISIGFNETVNITLLNRNNLELDLGSSSRYATYITGNNTKTLTFKYNITEGDESFDLNYVEGSLSGMQVSNSDNVSAILTLPKGSNSLKGTRDIIVTDKPVFTSVWNTEHGEEEYCAYNRKSRSVVKFKRNEITLPLIETGEYDFVVYWGDGTSDRVTSYNDRDKTHVYENYYSYNTYTIKIIGKFKGFGFDYTRNPRKVHPYPGHSLEYLFENLGVDVKYYYEPYFDPYFKVPMKRKEDLPPSCKEDMDGDDYVEQEIYMLEDITSWGSLELGNHGEYFKGSWLKDISADDVNLGMTTNLSDMFHEATEFDGNISSWNVSKVTDMNGMFYYASVFNQDLNSWDVSSVTDMSTMFESAKAFDGNISSWDVSSVTDMSYMFYSASVFNKNLNSWDVSSVTDMNVMFKDASEFNGDVSSWDVSSVTDMSGMFHYASVFNKNLNSWDVSSVTNMAGMFADAEEFNGDVSSWDVSSVTSMSSMFSWASAFNQDLNNWDISSVTDMSDMFGDASAFNQDLSSWGCKANSNLTHDDFWDGADAWADENKPKWGQPCIESVTTDLKSGSYGKGGVLKISLNFNKNVSVINQTGTPYFRIRL